MDREYEEALERALNPRPQYVMCGGCGRTVPLKDDGFTADHECDFDPDISKDTLQA